MDYLNNPVSLMLAAFVVIDVVVVMYACVQGILVVENSRQTRPLVPPPVPPSAGVLPTISTAPVHVSPQIFCPVCHTPTSRNDKSCSGCGLVFQSRVPSALHYLHRYQVLRPLGNGGMSSVYLAHQKDTRELCVLKTLLSIDGHNDPQWYAEAAHCLRQEATLLLQLDHPHIAQVREWVSNDQGEFLVLEYIPGLTLEQHLTRRADQGRTLPGMRLPLAEVVNYGCTVAGILEYLTSLPTPVVHHDIKPSNLIVRANDKSLILVDFGGAALLKNQFCKSTRIDCYGTPGYAAPEQYQGHSSPRSDVYGLAATLYHLLTDDDPTTHPFEFPQMGTLSPDIAAILRPALSREPKARPDVHQFHQALQRLVQPGRCR